MTVCVWAKKYGQMQWQLPPLPSYLHFLLEEQKSEEEEEEEEEEGKNSEELTEKERRGRERERETWHHFSSSKVG